MQFIKNLKNKKKRMKMH